MVLILAAMATTACGSSASSTETKGAPAQASNAAPAQAAHSAALKVITGSDNDTTRGSWTYEGDFWRSTDGTQNGSKVIDLNCRDKNYLYYERAPGEDQTIFDKPRVNLTQSNEGTVGMDLLPTDSEKNRVGSRLVTSVKARLSLNTAGYVTVHWSLTLWCVSSYANAWEIFGHSRNARGSAPRA